ncbi:nitrous oxide reductase accessory protein NosL [Terrilactibacillus sp. S3-3]|nr:nitrous oxide reductase accessory protein NosL [Terrilactibacillus sp. S3-3]
MAVLLAALVSACGSTPKAVAIGKNDVCAYCNMAIKNNQFATEIILKNNKVLKFDDIGCMMKWKKKENSNQKITVLYVRDYKTKEWVNETKATYVYAPGVKTPMAYSVVSFKNKANADKFSKENKGSSVMTANELKSHKWEMDKGMMKKNMSDGMNMNDKK